MGDVDNDFDAISLENDEVTFDVDSVQQDDQDIDRTFDRLAAACADGAARPHEVYLGPGSAVPSHALAAQSQSASLAASFDEVGASLDLLDLTLDEDEPFGPASSPTPDDPALAALRQGYIDRIDELTKNLAADSDRLMRNEPTLSTTHAAAPVAATIQSIAAMAKTQPPSRADRPTPSRPAGPAPPTTANLTAEQRRALANSLTKAVADMHATLQQTRDAAVAVAGDDALTAIMGVAYPLTSARAALHALRAEIDGSPVTAERGLPKVDVRDAGAAKRSLGLLIQAIDRLFTDTTAHLGVVKDDNVRLLRLGRLVSAARRAIASRV